MLHRNTWLLFFYIFSISFTHKRKKCIYLIHNSVSDLLPLVLGPSGSSSSRSAASSAMSPPPSSDSVEGDPNLSFTGGPIGGPIARIKSAIFSTYLHNTTTTHLNSSGQRQWLTHYSNSKPRQKSQQNLPNVFTIETKSVRYRTATKHTFIVAENQTSRENNAIDVHYTIRNLRICTKKLEYFASRYDFH